jgi:hypothetical protein
MTILNAKTCSGCIYINTMVFSDQQVTELKRPIKIIVVA